ncbi:prenyltransferase [Serinicoccus marinus]|uniref:prenyltransferase n=1 Tax=Serinicoccus marinus TaxID=247333 RepID=UPI0024904C93|nr:prenyltransferase [Serinicoccus marinus]
MGEGRRRRPWGGRGAAAFRLSRPDQVLLVLVVAAVGWLAGSRGASTEQGSTLAGWLAGAGGAPCGAGLAPLGVLTAAAGVLAVAVSVHAVNEFADAATDARTVRTRFSGGSGALADHGLPAVFALRVALAAGGAAVVVVGVGLVTRWVSGLVAVLLLVGLVGGWTYSVGPWPWSRHGWGEVVNAVLGGLLLPATGAVVAGAPLGWSVRVFVPFALLTFVNLLETQWPDREADCSVGKHTLASRLSAPVLRRAGAVAIVAAYLVSVVVHPWPVAAAGLLVAPLSVYAVARLGHGPPGPSVAAMVLFLLLHGAAWVLA